jgi:hypothetical protein
VPPSIIFWHGTARHEKNKIIKDTTRYGTKTRRTRTRHGPARHEFRTLTTYEYVVAMRAMSEEPAGMMVDMDEEFNNIVNPPTNSVTTGISVSSSLGYNLTERKQVKN